MHIRLLTLLLCQDTNSHALCLFRSRSLKFIERKIDVLAKNLIVLEPLPDVCPDVCGVKVTAMTRALLSPIPKPVVNPALVPTYTTITAWTGIAYHGTLDVTKEGKDGQDLTTKDTTTELEDGELSTFGMKAGESALLSREEEWRAVRRTLDAAKAKFDAIPYKDFQRLSKAVDLLFGLKRTLREQRNMQSSSNASLKISELIVEMQLSPRTPRAPFHVFCNAELPGAFIIAISHYVHTRFRDHQAL